MSVAASSSDDAGGPLVIYTTEFLNLELKDLIRNTLVASRLLLGGTLFDYLKLDLATKKEGDVLGFTGVIGVKPQDFKSLKIPAWRGIPEPPTDAKDKRLFQLAYVYAMSLSNAFKLLVLVSYTIRAPERRYLNTNPHLSLKKVYGRFSTDIKLSENLRESCGAFIPTDSFRRNFAAILDVLTSPKGSEVRMRRSAYGPEDFATLLFKWKSVFTKVLFLTEDIVPPLEEFGIVTTKKKLVDKPIPASDLRQFFNVFKRAIDKWGFERWAGLYQRPDLFNPYFLFFPMPRDTEGNVDVFTEKAEDVKVTPTAPNQSPFNEKNFVILAVNDIGNWELIIKFLILIFVRLYATHFFGSTDIELGRLDALRKELGSAYVKFIVDTDHVAYFNAINKHLNRERLPKHLLPLFHQDSPMYIFKNVPAAYNTELLLSIQQNNRVYNRHVFIRRYLVAISILNKPLIKAGNPLLTRKDIIKQGYDDLQSESDASLNEYLRFNYPSGTISFDLDLKPRLLKNTN